MKHIPEGGDFFSPEHASAHRDFGFHGSAEMSPHAGSAARDARGPKAHAEPMEHGGGEYAHGGHMHPHGGQIVREEHRADGGKVCHMSHGGMTIHHPDGHVTHHQHDGREVKAAEGGAMGMSHMHPHGHHVTNVEHHADGRVIHHHEHGGHTVHHTDGRITHHMSDGSPAHMAHGGIEGMHDSSEYVHRARGGGIEAEKGLIKKAFREHENAEHHGEHEDLHLARGGYAGKAASLPRGMKPAASRHHSPIGSEMPVNKPPRNPGMTTSPRNAMPGGQSPYGVEPSAEPDMAGSDQGISQLRRGGRAR